MKYVFFMRSVPLGASEEEIAYAIFSAANDEEAKGKIPGLMDTAKAVLSHVPDGWSLFKGEVSPAGEHGAKERIYPIYPAVAMG